MPRRIDAKQPEIVIALRAAGAQVQHLHMVGHGVPDLLVLFRQRLYLLEIKSRWGRLTEEEEIFHALWEPCVHVVRSVDEALAAIGAVRYQE